MRMCCGTIRSDAMSRARRGALACLLLGAVSLGPRLGLAADALTLQASDHSLALQLDLRFRVEGWDARASKTDWFTRTMRAAGRLLK